MIWAMIWVLMRGSSIHLQMNDVSIHPQTNDATNGASCVVGPESVHFLETTDSAEDSLNSVATDAHLVHARVYHVNWKQTNI